MSKTPMTPQDASRIQSNADRKGSTDGFKERAQSSGARNEAGNKGGGNKGGGNQGGGNKGSGKK